MELTQVLLITFAAQSLGTMVFAVFEIETPVWRRLLKWTIFHGATAGLFFAVGPWCLVFPGFFLLLGITAHTVICKREGFHPLYATPRRKYYAYRGWTWPEE